MLVVGGKTINKDQSTEKLDCEGKREARQTWLTE